MNDEAKPDDLGKSSEQVVAHPAPLESGDESTVDSHAEDPEAASLSEAPVPIQGDGSQEDKAEAEVRSTEPEEIDRIASGSLLPLDEARAATSSRPVDRKQADEAVLAESRRHTRRSFTVAALGAFAGYKLWDWTQSTQHNEEMLTLPQRRAALLNEKVAKAVLPEYPLAPTYPLSRAENLRINGIYGLKRDLDPASWRLQVVGMRDDVRHAGYVKDVTAWKYRYMAADGHDDKGHDTKVDPARERHSEGDGSTTAIKMAPAEMMDQALSDESKEEDENHTGRKPRGLEEAGESDSTLPLETPGVLLQLSDITGLPRHELVTQFKCIEGWSQIVHWAGFRMADFLEAFPPALIDGKEPRYIYMETPDGDYYVGYDLDVLRNPQALLVTEMMGQPLTQKHGAPVRLHTPAKYGYKQIKRIGLISYTNEKPDDYWTKLGYDWFGGL